ncbi:RNA-binding domain-containing protein [Peniophora sp. CONT]|nr:RNA-binding domain-containing protein [Peniophora sp. CONT]
MSHRLVDVALSLRITGRTKANVISRVRCRLRWTLAGPLPSLEDVSLVAGKHRAGPRAYTPGSPNRAGFSTEAQDPYRERTTTIIVGPLVSGVDYRQLKAAFSPCGTILQVSVRRNHTAGELLGYGYVRFESQEAVDKALRFNEMAVAPGRRPLYIRALFRHLDAVYVTGLGLEVDEEILKSMFEQCGGIVDATVRTTRHKSDLPGSYKTRIDGYVRFDSPASARSALGLSGMMVDDRPITVTYYVPQSRAVIYRAMKGEEPTSTSIHVSHLPPQLNDDWLKSEFKHCGEIISARVQRHLGNSLGYGYVAFVSGDAIDKALELNDKLVAGHSIRVQRSTSLFVPYDRRRNLDTTTAIILPNEIFVGKLTKDVDGARLRSEFERFGEVVSTTVEMHPRTKRTLGFGYVTFASRDSVEEAVKHDGMRIDGFSTLIRRARLDKDQRRKSNDAAHPSPLETQSE